MLIILYCIDGSILPMLKINFCPLLTLQQENIIYFDSMEVVKPVLCLILRKNSIYCPSRNRKYRAIFLYENPVK